MKENLYNKRIIMTTIIQEIVLSDKKHKEKIALITDKIKSDENLVSQLFKLLKTGSDVERGTAFEIYTLRQ